MDKIRHPLKGITQARSRKKARSILASQRSYNFPLQAIPKKTRASVHRLQVENELRFSHGIDGSYIGEM